MNKELSPSQFPVWQNQHSRMPIRVPLLELKEKYYLMFIAENLLKLDVTSQDFIKF
jgi:hypothetical protein